jgi:hypothetical protein
MPYDPLMLWETEGRAVLSGDDEDDRIRDHADRPEAKLSSPHSHSSHAGRCVSVQADRCRADDRRPQASMPG